MVWNIRWQKNKEHLYTCLPLCNPTHYVRTILGHEVTQPLTREILSPIFPCHSQTLLPIISGSHHKAWTQRIKGQHNIKRMRCTIEQARRCGALRDHLCCKISMLEMLSFFFWVFTIVLINTKITLEATQWCPLLLWASRGVNDQSDLAK